MTLAELHRFERHRKGEDDAGRRFWDELAL